MSDMTVKLTDFNSIDGIRANYTECELCLERRKPGETGIPVMSASYGLIRVCGACWGAGYVALDLDKLEMLVREHTNTGNTCEVVEIHPMGEYTTKGIDPKVIVNLGDNPQAWACFADGCNIDITDENI